VTLSSFRVGLIGWHDECNDRIHSPSKGGAAGGGAVCRGHGDGVRTAGGVARIDGACDSSGAWVDREASWQAICAVGESTGVGIGSRDRDVANGIPFGVGLIGRRSGR